MKATFAVIGISVILAGLSLRAHESPRLTLARLVFTQDYFPGTKDTNGQFMGGTEAMWLAGHDGKLFAAIGYGQDRPGNDLKPGAQVLRKDAPDAPWRVDHAFEPNCMRVEGLISFAFTTDLHGKPLAKPARLLIASPSELTRAGGASAVFIRNDTTGQWQRSEITGGNLGVRSFGSHVDKATGVHHIFAGLNRGGIHRGSYDPATPGGIRWEPLPERTAEAQTGKGRRIYDYSRVLCFAECNGDFYMASRITTDESGQPVEGGLYRRVDGAKPSWELVHRWTIDKEVLQSRFLRGLSTVPDPNGGKHQVLIANFEYPGLIARFNPAKGVVTAEQELDIKDFFNQAWNTPTARRRGAIAAYNRFLPVNDPKTGEPLWLCGAWVERPDSKNPPNNGSCYLIRHRDGRYDWGYIYDDAHPVPADQKLTGCRDIEPSPFPGEQGRVFYFCGYDGGAGPSHNTAWIYRGELSAKNGNGRVTKKEVATMARGVAGERSFQIPAAAEMEMHKDIRYRELPGVDAEFHMLDVYSPKDATGLPVLFWIHGGGLTGGSKDAGRNLPKFCARMGMVLVSINYRLSPAAKHPSHIQDCAAAFKWTYANIRQYGGDPRRIFVAGHSSGAQLANLLCTDARRLAGEGLGLANIKGAIIFDSAAYDMPPGRVTPGSIYEKAFGTDPEVLKDGSPVSHIAPGRNIPPHLLLGAKPPQMPMETKVKNLDAVAAKYRAAGVRCEVACAPFRQHNTLIGEFGLAEEPVTVEVTKFIQSILNAEPVNPPLGGPAKVLHLSGKTDADVQRENDIKSAKTLLKALDTNGDGKVSRAEAEARGGGHWLRWFPLLDKNKDDFITVEEQTVNTQPTKTP